MKTGLIKVAIGVLAALPFIVTSCLMNDSEDFPDFNKQLEKDIATIDSYLAAKNITALQDASGIRYVIYRETTGNKPTIDSCVTANYEGLLMSTGQKFDEGKNTSFPLIGVIDGWKIGIPLLHEGDSATLYIPSGLAYGYYGYPPEIPSNANLIFNVGVHKVGKTYKTSDRSCN